MQTLFPIHLPGYGWAQVEVPRDRLEWGPKKHASDSGIRLKDPGVAVRVSACQPTAIVGQMSESWDQTLKCKSYSHHCTHPCAPPLRSTLTPTLTPTIAPHSCAPPLRPALRPPLRPTLAFHPYAHHCAHPCAPPLCLTPTLAAILRQSTFEGYYRHREKLDGISTTR